MNEIPLQYLILGITVIIVATFIFITGIIFDIHEFKNRKMWENASKRPSLHESVKQIEKKMKDN